MGIKEMSGLKIVELYLENRKDMDESERKLMLEVIYFISNPVIVDGTKLNTDDVVTNLKPGKIRV